MVAHDLICDHLFNDLDLNVVDQLKSGIMLSTLSYRLEQFFFIHGTPPFWGDGLIAKRSTVFCRVSHTYIFVPKVFARVSGKLQADKRSKAIALTELEDADALSIAAERWNFVEATTDDLTLL